jgi:hypothetical protein
VSAFSEVNKFEPRFSGSWTVMNERVNLSNHLSFQVKKFNHLDRRECCCLREAESSAAVSACGSIWKGYVLTIIMLYEGKVQLSELLFAIYFDGDGEAARLLSQQWMRFRNFLLLMLWRR